MIHLTFQSLLRQGTSSNCYNNCDVRVTVLSFNPFFVRALLRTVQSGGVCDGTDELVSIPSSSGHFFERPHSLPLHPHTGWVSIPSSSGHFFELKWAFKQLEADLMSFNPFFVRALLRTDGHRIRHAIIDATFQSLLRQGTSSNTAMFKSLLFNLFRSRISSSAL